MLRLLEELLVCCDWKVACCDAFPRLHFPGVLCLSIVSVPSVLWCSKLLPRQAICIVTLVHTTRSILLMLIISQPVGIRRLNMWHGRVVTLYERRTVRRHRDACVRQLDACDDVVEASLQV
jgi:hypothetical protein